MENWEVVVSASMNDEASVFLRKLRFKLVKQFGDEVRHHFRDPSKEPNFKPKYTVKKKKNANRTYMTKKLKNSS